jgi:3-isopropylmalate dehydratase small subunit
MEDLQVAAEILKGKQVSPACQLLVIPASRKIYLKAMEEGIIQSLIESGANVLSPSCGPCLGTGQGIPADGYTVISTANRNFKGRMGNPNAEIFLASPATVALSVMNGKITSPVSWDSEENYPYNKEAEPTITIEGGDNRKVNGVWNYCDIDNLNTDQMFAGNLTYNVLSSDAEAIMPHLFAGFDSGFVKNLSEGDIIIAGDNFGCGSSREHPAVGLAHAGVKAVIVKSVNRIFFRSAINQGLAIIVNPEVVEHYKPGDTIEVDFEAGNLQLNNKEHRFAPLPEKLMAIIRKKGLVNWMKEA